MNRNDRWWPLRRAFAASTTAATRAGQAQDRHHRRRCRARRRCSACSSATASSSRVKTLGGKLGGREVELIVQDDELKPDVAVGKVKAFVERDKVDFVVGPIFSNILIAIMKPVTDGGTFLISPNAGTSNFAGKECNPNFFVTSYQNDQLHEVLGQVRAGHGHQEGVHHGAELPGRQGLARRLQALLQGRDRRRGLCAARPARLLGRARRRSPPRSPTRSSCSCRAAWA